MFYCDTCAERLNWPKTMFKSRGRCEMCEKPAVCNDTPSRLLPEPPPRSNLLARSLEAPEGWRAEQFAAGLQLLSPEGEKVFIPHPHDQQTVEWWKAEVKKAATDPAGYRKALEELESKTGK